MKYSTLCTSSTTTFITCEATCFDLNYISSSGLLTIEYYRCCAWWYPNMHSICNTQL